MTESIRLAKRIAELRACSRREAELIITGGWVRVDGVVIEEPQFRVSDQHVEIDSKASPGQVEPVTLLLHKPAGYDVLPDNAGQAAAALLGPATWWAENAANPAAGNIRPLKIHFTQLNACTPLDRDTHGLVVYTQDWRIARKLTEDAATVEHEFVVEVAGDLAANRDTANLERMRGIPFNGRTSTSLKVSWQNETRLRVALKGAQIGQINKLCAAIGLEVLSMKRIRLGGVSMGKLPAGQWRYLRMQERF